jgi:ABC-2 type transport system permease protein
VTTTAAGRPSPPASAAKIVVSQTGMELRLTLRRGESLLLTFAIPLLLLVFFKAADIEDAGIGFLVPGVLALAVMSAAFTGQAIATGYERAYGVLTRLGTTPLTRTQLLLAKTAGVVVVEVIQALLIGLVGLGLGWHLHGNVGAALLLLVVGTATFSGLGLLMAGTLRAEATLAGANGIYLVLLLLGGVVFPLSKLPGWLQGVAHVFPTAALSHGLRAALQVGGGPDGSDLAILAGWAVGSLALAARTFRWAA